MTKLQLELILPVFNERKAIESVLEEWHRALSPTIHYRFIICEDGSTDGTRKLLVKLKKKYPILLNVVNKRRGYSRAIVDGILSAQAPYVLCVDSDGQCDPSDFPSFWQMRESADVVIGWRTDRAHTWLRKLFSTVFKWYFLILFPTTIHDPSTSFVLFRPEHIVPYLSELTMLEEGFEWGLVGICIKHHLSLKEVSVRHRQRIDGQTNIFALRKIPRIAFSNTIGLFRLRFAS